MPSPTPIARVTPNWDATASDCAVVSPGQVGSVGAGIVSRLAGPAYRRRVVLNMRGGSPGCMLDVLRRELSSNCRLQEVGIGALGTLPLWPTLPDAGSLRKPCSSSSGNGNTMVLFFSAAISVNVCRYRSCKVAG